MTRAGKTNVTGADLTASVLFAEMSKQAVIEAQVKNVRKKRSNAAATERTDDKRVHHVQEAIDSPEVPERDCNIDKQQSKGTHKDRRRHSVEAVAERRDTRRKPRGAMAVRGAGSKGVAFNIISLKYRI